MKLTIRKSEWLDDWYVIERAEHDGRKWLEPIEGVTNGRAFMHSGRISDADVEGTRAEMLDIARAIKERGYCYHKRCAIQVDGYRAWFWSPRNSQRRAEVPLHRADALAALITSTFAEHSGESGGGE